MSPRFASSRLRIGVIFDQDPHVGGGFQQALNDVLTVVKLDASFDISIIVLKKRHLALLADHNLSAIHFCESFVDKLEQLFRRVCANFGFNLLFACFPRFCPLERFLIRKKIDVVFFPSPSHRAADLSEINFVFTLLDLCHLEHPEFPEVRFRRNFEFREKLYSTVLRKSAAVLVESEIGKENAAYFYRLNPEKVFVNRMLPAQRGLRVSPENVLARYSLPKPFIFYPAQFWAHKNHVYILQSISELRSNYASDVHVVFVGSDKGSRDHVLFWAEKLGIIDLVHCLGFVPQEHISSLYTASFALVMPTYFGPTNLPPLEAFSFGVPVIYSDLPGLRDQVASAALKVSLSDPSSLSSALKTLLESPQERDQLIQRGFDRYHYLVNEERRLKTFRRVFSDFEIKRSTWE